MSGDGDRLTAYHEAGHAIVAHLLGLTVSQVEIVGDAEELGSCHTQRFSCMETIAREHALEDALLVACAGVVAECLATGAGRWDEDSRDLEHAVHLALRLTGDCEKAHALILRTRRRVKRALTRHWDAVEVLAAHLRTDRRIGARDVAAILDRTLAHPPPRTRPGRSSGSFSTL